MMILVDQAESGCSGSRVVANLMNVDRFFNARSGTARIVLVCNLESCANPFCVVASAWP